MNPNDIVGQPREYDVWLAPDWGDWKPKTQKQPSGYTFASVRETRYADGRVVTEVLDANRAPIQTRPLDVTPDPAQEKRFKDAQAAAARDATQIPGNAIPGIEGTPTGRTLPDGRPEFDNSKPIMVFRTPDGKQVDARPLQVGERQQWERDNNQAAGRGPYTDADLPVVASKAAADRAAADKAAAANQPASATAAVPGYPGWTATTTKTPATPTTPEREVTTYTGPDGKPRPSLPAKPDAPAAPDIKVVTGSDGKPYTITTTLGPNNVPRVVTADDQGRPVAVIPGQVKQDPISAHRNPETGEWEEVYRDPVTGRAAIRTVPGQAATGGPKAPAPSLPTIVVGQSQDALRTAYTQIQEEVDSGRRTAAWGENRRKEVFEAAQLTVNEAHIAEQSRQANQTTAFNVANAQMNYGQSSLTNALKFTLDINDKLKPGSGSGGRMFAALFNMQMAMGMASGMYGMNVPRGSSVGAPGAPGQPAGAPGAPVQPTAPKLSNVGDPAAVEADHQQSLARLAAGDAADAAAGPGGRAMTPSMGGPAQALPIRGGLPVTSTPALQSSPGGPAVPPVPLPQPAAVPGAPPAAMPSAAPAPGFGDPGFYRGPPGGGEAQDPGFYRGPPGGGEQQDPGFYRPDLQGDQRQGFAALDALRQQYAPQPAAPQIDAAGGLDPMTGGIGIPPALQRAQIAATPPWRLDPASLESLVQQHGEEAVFGWPGQSLLGLG